MFSSLRLYQCHYSQSNASTVLRLTRPFFLLQRINAKILCHMSHHTPVYADLAGHNPDSRPLEQYLFVNYVGIAYASSAVEGGCG